MPQAYIKYFIFVSSQHQPKFSYSLPAFYNLLQHFLITWFSFWYPSLPLSTKSSYPLIHTVGNSFFSHRKTQNVWKERLKKEIKNGDKKFWEKNTGQFSKRRGDVPAGTCYLRTLQLCLICFCCVTTYQ